MDTFAMYRLCFGTMAFIQVMFLPKKIKNLEHRIKELLKNNEVNLDE